MMSRVQFDRVLELVRDDIEKENTHAVIRQPNINRKTVDGIIAKLVEAVVVIYSLVMGTVA